MGAHEATKCQQYLCRAVNDNLSDRKSLNMHINWLTVQWFTMMPTSSMSFLIATALILSALIPAFLSQALHASQPSCELGRFLVEFPCGGDDCVWQPVKPTGSLNLSGIGMHLPKAKTGIFVGKAAVQDALAGE